MLDGANAFDFERRESEYASNANTKQRVDRDGKLVALKEF